MDFIVLLEYGWILLVLIFLEGVLATDNALVIAVVAKQLPEELQKKALYYGLAGAFVFRFLSLFAISYIFHVWQLQALGATYLLFISTIHVYRKRRQGDWVPKQNKSEGDVTQFWITVLKVELLDIVFAFDSILAAVALAVTLPKTPLPPIGGVDGGHFLIILAGGMIGMILMRFAASFFTALLHKRPGLEMVAFLIIGWVGVKLAVITLSHEAVSILPKGFSSSITWKLIFWGVLLAIAILGWYTSDKTNRAREK